MRYKGEHVDLILRINCTMGLINRYSMYYYDIVLANSSTTIGYIELRVGQSNYLYYLGNIGYRIDEEYRGNHYAYQACLIVFKLAKEIGIDSLIITCDPTNMASKKTLERLNGTLIEIAKVPVTNPLYLQGDRIKCIYQFQL